MFRKLGKKLGEMPELLHGHFKEYERQFFYYILNGHIIMFN
jgi:hypothetical protein